MKQPQGNMQKSGSGLCAADERRLRCSFAVRAAGWLGSVLSLLGLIVLPALAARGAQAQPTPPPLVLAGGTIIDLSNWGHSANDLHDAVIFIRDGRITTVGPRAAIPIPKGATVIDCTGK